MVYRQATVDWSGSAIIIQGRIKPLSDLFTGESSLRNQAQALDGLQNRFRRYIHVYYMETAAGIGSVFSYPYRRLLSRVPWTETVELHV